VKSKLEVLEANFSRYLNTTKIFASKYKLYLPEKKILEERVRIILDIEGDGKK